METKNFTYSDENKKERPAPASIDNQLSSVRNAASNSEPPKKTTVNAMPDTPFNTDETGFVPETLESTMFIPGFLTTQLGNYMRVEFLIGNLITDRTGILTKVGASYIVLRQQNGDNILCDLFAIKFVTIISAANRI